jgi:hypothetical protein
MLVDYNTQRTQIGLREYGRNIHTMVHNLTLIEDRERRNNQAKDLVELMRQFIQPGSKENADLTHKIWDDLFIISDFKLDVDCPFPIPDKSVIGKKPEKLNHTLANPFYRHYGKNVELLVEQISQMPDGAEKEDAIIYVGRLMKTFFAQYNKDIAEDAIIKNQLEKLSKGKIVLDLEKIKTENLLDANTKFTDRRVGNSNDEIRLEGNNKNRNRNNRNRNRGGKNNDQKHRRK